MTVPLAEFRWADFSFGANRSKNDSSSERRTFAHLGAVRRGCARSVCITQSGASRHICVTSLFSKARTPSTLRRKR